MEGVRLMSRRTAGLIFCLPVALAVMAGTALAQEGSTTVPKKSPPPATAVQPQQQAPASPVTAPPQIELRPAQDVNEPAAPIPPAAEEAAAPTEEIVPPKIDEGAGWDAAVEAAPAPTPLIGEEQTQAVERINGYFNAITNLQGRFDQIDATNKRTTGRFYVQRPGKIRFDYAPPSALRIVADGHFLAIEDGTLKTVEKYPIESTPFRLLLTASVDLSRDARIVGVERQEGTLAISLEDKSGSAAGRMKLYFESEPEMQLKQWTISDAQGLTTTVTVNDVVPGRKVATDFFTSKESFQPFR